MANDIIIEWHGEEVILQLRNHLFTNVDNASKVLLDETRANCPVKTGKMKNRLFSNVEQTENETIGYVENPVEYARHVVEGGPHNAPNPFMQQAAEKAKQSIQKELEKGE